MKFKALIDIITLMKVTIEFESGSKKEKQIKKLPSNG